MTATKDRIVAALKPLPAKQRDVILLRLRGFRWHEIAKALGMGKRTISTHSEHAFCALDVSSLGELFCDLMGEDLDEAVKELEGKK